METVKAYFRRLYELTLDLNYDISSLEWRQLDKTSKSKTPAILEGLSRIAWKSVLALRYYRRPSCKSKLVFLIGSKNNLTSIGPILEHVQGASLIGYNGEVAKSQHIPELWFYLYAILAVPKFLVAYFLCQDTYIRWTMRKRLDRYLLGFNSIAVWERVLKGLGCQVLILTNDHVVWSRAAMYAAQNLKITTVFVPHAPTGENPPPLQFDYAFLDGEAQLEKYTIKCNSGTKVILSGAVRYQSLVKLSQRVGEGVLVCYNALDDLEFIRSSLREVVKHRDHRKVYVRPHPADTRRFASIEEICRSLDVEFPDPSAPIEGVMERVAVVLAGLSGVHVDALMSGRKAVTFREWYPIDYYGLQGMGVIEVLESWSAIHGVLEAESPMFPIQLEALNWNVSDVNLVPSRAVAQFLKILLRDKFPVGNMIIIDEFSFKYDELISAYRSYRC